MKNGFGLIAVLVGIGIFILIGSAVGAAVVLRQDSREISTISELEQERKEKNSDEFGALNKQEEASNSVQPSPTPTPAAVTPSPTPTPATPTTPTVYSQPQGLYKITLPPGWVVNSTFATQTYSTTKFVGSPGSISITFGNGKDPLGGCSEPSAVTLGDRIISGCYLLQRDGSRILTRAYTNDKAGLPITVEAYMSPPLSVNQPEVMDVVGTIDIY